MTIKVVDCATMSPPNSASGRRAQLLPLLLLLVCLWDCLRIEPAVATIQVMAPAVGPTNRSVPRARFGPQTTTTTTTLSGADLVAIRPTDLATKSATFELVTRGGNANNLKYVNYTRVQIEAKSGSLNESAHKPEDPIERQPPKRWHNISRRSPDQQPFGMAGLVGPPKLVQWSKEAVHYYEGSTLVLSCSLSHSGGERGGQLKFAWFKHGKSLASGSSLTPRLSIETLADYSFLRLADLRASDSGAYTCVVSNSINQEDRTTTQVIVNVKLKWLMPTKGDIAQNNKTIIGNGNIIEKARVGQPVSFECNAAGGPNQPRGLVVRWFRLIPSVQTPAESMSHEPLHNRSLAMSHSINRQAMDEARIRKSLLQLDTIQAPTEAYNRIELTKTGGSHGDNDFKTNDKLRHSSAFGSSNNQIRWHIESNPSTSAQFQQNEIHSRLVLDRLDPSMSGLYECEVISGSSSSAELIVDSSGLKSTPATAGDKLRRLFGLFVNGK